MYGIFLFGRDLNRTIIDSVRRRYENVALIGELTEQKAQAEAARTRSRRSANRMKTRFLAAASHDLRQPLHALGLFSDSLKRRIADPEQKAIAEHICESVDALEQTFDALLDISRLDAGIVQPKTEGFALTTLLQRVAGDCAPEAAAKGIALRVRVTRLATRSDPVLVEQILRNLASNAIRYTDRGKVLIGCRRRGAAVSRRSLGHGNRHRRDKRQRIFDEFYQADERDRARASVWAWRSCAGSPTCSDQARARFRPSVAARSSASAAALHAALRASQLAAAIRPSPCRPGSATPSCWSSTTTCRFSKRCTRPCAAGASRR